jgi:hypothetical protein
MEIIINQSHIFELILTNNQGDFVTGQTVGYEVRNSSTDALITSGNLTEQNEVYKFSHTFTTLGQFRIKYTTPMNFPNAIESVDIVNSIADRVWDEPLAGHTSSGTTGEALADADAMIDPSSIADAVWDEAIGDHLLVGSTGRTLSDIEADTNEIQGKLPDNNIMGSSTTTDKDDEIDAIKSKTDNLPVDPASETNVDANETKIDSIITTLGTLIADIWSYVTRTLTGIGTSGIASESNATTNKNDIITQIDDNETKIDNLSTQLTNAETNIITEIDANEVKIDAITTDITAHRNTVETKILNILGLTQHNTQIKDQVYDASDNLTSATIRLYPSGTDAENDTNHFQEYFMTAEYDSESRLTKYVVKE